MLRYFSKEGEDVYKNTQSLTVLLFLDILLNLEITQFEAPKELKIWKARYHMLHNMLLTSNVCSLQDKSLGFYQEYLDQMSGEDKNTQAYLWVEYSICCLTFYKYSKAEQALENARVLIGVKFKLTGKMGRRTKYQSFDTPQLVLNIETEQVEQFIHPEVSSLDSIIGAEKPKEQEGEGEGEEEHKIAHGKVDLDEDSILLEKILLKEEESKMDINLSFQIYFNGVVHNELTSQVNEYDLQYERINAYIEKVLEKSHNWLIFSMSLFLRSKNEQEKLKTRERSMIQMQNLIDQYRDEEP